MFDQGCGHEASPSWVGRQFLGESVASKLKGDTGTKLTRCLIKLLAVPDIMDLVVIV
jgi:hypothetical protein